MWFGEVAEWVFEEDAENYGEPGWICSKCYSLNKNIPKEKYINPFMFTGSRFCPSCGREMIPSAKGR